MPFLNENAEAEYIKQCERMRYDLARYGSANSLLRQRHKELTHLRAAVGQVMNDLRSAGLYEYSDRLREILKGYSK
jgi:hypothetical protein